MIAITQTKEFTALKRYFMLIEFNLNEPAQVNVPMAQFIDVVLSGIESGTADLKKSELLIAWLPSVSKIDVKTIRCQECMELSFHNTEDTMILEQVGIEYDLHDTFTQNTKMIL